MVMTIFRCDETGYRAADGYILFALLLLMKKHINFSEVNLVSCGSSLMFAYQWSEANFGENGTNKV